MLEIVGDFAFEYGFFAGHEDFRLCADPIADICVTYPHRSLEEFFGSFGFLQALDSGQSVDDILSSDCKKPIFMVNPLVLQFCLWLLTTTEFFSSWRIVYNKLVAYVAHQIDTHLLDIGVVDEIFPAMCIRKALLDEDTLKLEFFKQVFEKCDHVRVLQIRPDPIFGRDWTCNDFGTDVLGVLGLISHSLLSKLSLLSISEDFTLRAPPDLNSAPPDLNSNAFTVSIDSTDIDCYMEISKILQTRCDVLKRDPQVCARIWKSQDLKDLMQRHIKELHVVSNQDFSEAPLYASGEFPFCPQFTHFTAEYFQVDNSVPAAFMKAVKDGKFPNLKRNKITWLHNE